jgi:hypothetical protein
MTVRTQEEEMEIVKAALDSYPRYKNVQANERLLLEACQGKPANAHSVRAVLEAIKPRLVVNADYAEAYNAIFQEYPQYRVDANINYLDGLISVRQTIDYAILARLVETPQVREKLVLTPQAAQANADEAERLQIIEEILQGRDVYEWRGNTDGRIYSGKRSELEQDTLERLRYIRDVVMTQRALYAADTKTLREAQRKRELREAQLRAGMTKETKFEPIPDSYESPNRPGVKQPWSENLLRRLPNSEIERVFNLYGEQALTVACRKSQQL